MNTRLFSSRYIVPIDSAPMEHGAMAVKDGRIVALGPKSELVQRFAHAPCTDYGDAILLPALVNAHTHLELSHFGRWHKQINTYTRQDQAAEKGHGFTNWILSLIELKKHLGRDAEIYRSAWHTGLHQSQCYGTGYIGDILTTPELCQSAAQHLPGRGFIEVLGHDPAQVHGQLERLEHWAHAAPDALWGAAPHSPYTMSQDMLKLSFRTAAAHHLPSSIHVAESDEEVDFLHSAEGPMARQLYPYVRWEHLVHPARNMRPLECLQQAGGLSPRTLLVHAVHINNTEVAQIAASGASVVLCPRSNARLDCGKAPAAEYLRHNVPLALGTDSLASNSSLSIWDEMAFALQWFAGALSPEKLLHMATQGGATALQISDAGSLSPGKRATFQVITPATLPDRPELFNFLCNSRRGREISAIYRDGIQLDLSQCNEETLS